MNSLRTKILICIFLIVLLVGCRLFLPTELAVFVIGSWGYWIMLAGVSLYLYQVVSNIKIAQLYVGIRKYKLGLLFASLGTLFFECNEPRQFKVLHDEFVISGVARNMHFVREPTYSFRAHNVKDELEVFDATIDKRPFFFPFVLSVLHDLTGYRPANVFVLNGIVVFALLFSLYYFGYQFGSWRLGLMCTGLFVGLPLVAQSATSAGYDVFNLLMLMLYWYFGREYIRSGSIRSQNLFVLTTVFLAQVRYESVLLVAPMVIIILIRWYRQKAVLLGWITAVFPVFLLLPVLINLVFSRTPIFWQTNPGQAFFSLNYLPENFGRAVWYLFDLNFGKTNSLILSTVGLVSIVTFYVKSIRKWKCIMMSDDDVILLLMGGFILANFILVLSCFWGQIEDQSASRFSLPLHLLFVCSFAWFANASKFIQTIPRWLGCLVALEILIAVPAVARHVATRTLIDGREYAWLEKELESPLHRDALVIAAPVGLILYNHPAISREVAEDNKWKIAECLRQRIYPEILVMEVWSIDSKTGLEVPYGEDRSVDYKKGTAIGERKTALSNAFRKEIVSETRFRANIVVRLSRVVEVLGAAAQPPESYLKEKPPFESSAAYYKHIYSCLP